MFEIRCIVGDKKLSDALKALGGLTLEPPVVVAVMSNGSGHRTDLQKIPGESSATILLKHIADKKLKTITVQQMRSHLESLGYTKNGYSYAMQRLVAEGKLKKTKTYSLYAVSSK